MLELKTKSVITVATLIAVLALLTPTFGTGAHQLRSTVGQAVPQDQAPSLPSSDFLDVTVAAILLVTPVIARAQQATSRPQPKYVSAGHSAPLFVRPPPVR